MKYRMRSDLPTPLDGRGRGAHPVTADFVEVCRRNPDMWVEYPLSRRWPGAEITNDHRRSAATSCRHFGLTARQIDGVVWARAKDKA